MVAAAAAAGAVAVADSAVVVLPEDGDMKTVLTESELKGLADLIADIEGKTAGEIRLMLVGRSISVGHVFPIAWLGFLSLSLLVVWFERHNLILTAQWWTIPTVILITFLMGFVVAHFNWVKRLLTPTEDIIHQVWQRAELEFHREGLNETSGRTGILLFVSLLEHQAVVLGDRAIAERLSKDVWLQVVNKMLEGPRSGQWAKKLEEALQLCGDLLIERFPAREGNKNELPNHVIIKP